MRNIQYLNVSSAYQTEATPTATLTARMMFTVTISSCLIYVVKFKINTKNFTHNKHV